MPTFVHGRNTVLLADAYDISNILKMANLTSTADVADTTAFGSTFKSSVVGMLDGKLSTQGYFDAATDAAVINAIFGTQGKDTSTYGWPVTYAPGGITLGARVWGLQAHEATASRTSGVSEVVGIQADFVSSLGIRSGVGLGSYTTLIASTVTGTGVSTTYGTAPLTATTGGWGVLHVVSNASVGGTGYTVELQSSTTLGGTYVTFATFDVVAPATITSQWLGVPVGVTVNEFVRMKVTQAVTTPNAGIQLAVSYMRNP